MVIYTFGIELQYNKSKHQHKEQKSQPNKLSYSGDRKRGKNQKGGGGLVGGGGPIKSENWCILALFGPFPRMEATISLHRVL